MKCELCDKKYLNKKSLNNHKRRVHKIVQRVFSNCQYCKTKSFYNAFNLENHERACYEKYRLLVNLNNISKEEEMVNCEICDVSFKVKYKASHLRSMTHIKRNLKKISHRINLNASLGPGSCTRHYIYMHEEDDEAEESKSEEDNAIALYL
ncbi:hypothetical protein PVAND_014347 [Polypedilum vanderplanki]|uniref:C2H2-type domain-containing protein n=1 Tax=Polypedilum vanderplanki TaxID=319348 RepID=A0A9J6CTQ7_POLVA|nr:hypothetical protein PVAND_014347 [Polypedilum vanderplanki]